MLLFSAAMFVVSVIKLPIKFTLQLPLNNSRNDYVTVTFICPYDESLNVATTSEEFVESHNLSCIKIARHFCVENMSITYVYIICSFAHEE